ncbi:MAG TPA: class I SAM-dependent methyltransferase [Aliidongia sp.]|nr:class I SAM-dependent methyltransferase [Aliidongia sp.]
MSDTLDRLAFGAARGARFSWYFGQRLLAERLVKPAEPVSPEIRARMPSTRRLLQDMRALLIRDFDNIAAGLYARPEEPAAGPIGALKRARAFFRDLPVVDERRHAERHQDVPRDEAGEFPRYYLQNFHYQTDGWLSRESAELYDHQVEVLFMGCADTMRRQALVPLGTEIAARGQRRARLIDIACGTGLFLREVKANWPRLEVTGLDLSPFYLDKTRENLADWSGVRTIAAPAEAVPEPEGAFDLATSIFLFHELPPQARRRVAAELGRLVRPGGLLVLVDSLQTGDLPDYDALLEVFPARFHEPYYAGYLHEDLGAIFAEAGFGLESVDIAFLTKVMAFRKHPKP